MPGLRFIKCATRTVDSTNMPARVVIVLLMIAILTSGCRTVDVTTRLVIRDKQTGENLEKCLLVRQTRSQTMGGFIFSHMPSNLGTSYDLDICRVNSGDDLTLRGVSGSVFFALVFHAETCTEWSYDIYKPGYIPQGFSERDISRCAEENRALIVEMEPYVPGRTQENDEAMLDGAKYTTYFYAYHLPKWNPLARELWGMMGDTLEGLLRARPADWVPAEGWTRKDVVDLIAKLRELQGKVRP